MAWKGHVRPKTRRCTGCKKVKPHTRRYFRFTRKRIPLRDGGITVSYYAQSLCLSCARRKERENWRIDSYLSGKPKRPQDVPWKKYREPYKRPKRSVDVSGILPSIDLAWKASGLTKEALCRRAGIDSSYWRRGVRNGKMVFWALESLLIALDLEDLLDGVEM